MAQGLSPREPLREPLPSADRLVSSCSRPQALGCLKTTLRPSHQQSQAPALNTLKLNAPTPRLPWHQCVCPRVTKAVPHAGGWPLSPAPLGTRASLAARTSWGQGPCLRAALLVLVSPFWFTSMIHLVPSSRSGIQPHSPRLGLWISPVDRAALSRRPDIKQTGPASMLL